MVMGTPILSQQTVRPGASITVDWTQNWSRLCPGTVNRQLTTEHGEIKTFKAFAIYPPDKLGVISRESRVYVPHTTPAGTATLQSTISFHCNFLQEIWPIVVKAPPIIIQVASAAD